MINSRACHNDKAVIKKSTKNKFKSNYQAHVGFKMPERPEFIRQKEN
jgi:hypothetical protein